jgi:protein-tyrosine kinase
MSRNLELLERAERHAQLLRRPAFASHRAASAAQDHHTELASASRRPSEHVSETTKQQLFVLINNLVGSAETDTPRAVGFCGVDGEAGSGWIAACAAELSAVRLNADVCLVDANVAGGGVHSYFGLENGHGLLDCLCDNVTPSANLRRVSPKLVLLTSGSRGPEDRLPLNGDALRSCFADLRASFDHLIVNLGGAEAAKDAFLLSHCLDGIVLVIDADTTSRAAAQRTKEAFECAGMKLLGAVLNNREFPVPRVLDSWLQRFFW